MYCAELRFDKPSLGLQIEEGNKKGLWGVKFQEFILPLLDGFKKAIEQGEDYRRAYEYQRALLAATYLSTASDEQKEGLLVHGDPENTRRNYQHYAPRPFRLWEAKVAPRQNRRGHAQFIPSAGRGKSTLLVHIMATKDARSAHDLFIEGSFLLPHIVRVHEDAPKSLTGERHEALVVLQSGQRIELQKYAAYKGNSRTIYTWNAPYLHMYQPEAKEKQEQRFDIPTLIEAEKAKDQAAYAALIDLAQKYEFVF